MISPVIPESRRFNPFALKPGQDAYGAVSKTMARYQVAWPFTPIDQGEEQDFVERWMERFADAAQGKLYPPRHMPELNVKGSWRHC